MGIIIIFQGRPPFPLKHVFVNSLPFLSIQFICLQGPFVYIIFAILILSWDLLLATTPVGLFVALTTPLLAPPALSPPGVVDVALPISILIFTEGGCVNVSGGGGGGCGWDSFGGAHECCGGRCGGGGG